VEDVVTALTFGDEVAVLAAFALRRLRLASCRHLHGHFAPPPRQLDLTDWRASRVDAALDDAAAAAAAAVSVLTPPSIDRDDAGRPAGRLCTLVVARRQVVFTGAVVVSADSESSTSPALRHQPAPLHYTD